MCGHLKAGTISYNFTVILLTFLKSADINKVRAGQMKLDLKITLKVDFDVQQHCSFWLTGCSATQFGRPHTAWHTDTVSYTVLYCRVFQDSVPCTATLQYRTLIPKGTVELDLKLGSNATVSACGVRGVDASTEAGLQVDQKHGFGSRSECQFVCIGFDPYYLTWLSPRPLF